jgi:ABC-type Zn uptake system ZnuABC Zn-binding protein ZnuA
MVLKVKKADMIVRVGMDLDMWIESLIDASRNEHVAIGARGYVDASENVYKLEVPKIKVDPSMGHLHVYGNPHYLIGPQNVPAVLGSILNGLIRVSPENESYFKANKEAYEAEFNQSMEKWKAIMAPLKGRRIVAYHKSWEYFAKCFELNIAGYLEPKPGIPPSPAHLDALIKQMRNEKISLIIQESFYSKKTGEMVARQTGAKLLVLPPAVGAQDMNTYLGLIDHIVNEISSALTR